MYTKKLLINELHKLRVKLVYELLLEAAYKRLSLIFQIL